MTRKTKPSFKNSARILMSFDEAAEIPVVDLMTQWGANQPKVISLIGGAKRMTPVGDAAKELIAMGYPPSMWPKWFASKYKAPPQGLALTALGLASERLG